MNKPNITSGNWQNCRDGIYSSDGNLCIIESRHIQGESIEQARATATFLAASVKMAEALEYAGELIKTARRYFPKSVRNSDTFQLENTCAAITKALLLAGYTHAHTSVDLQSPAFDLAESSLTPAQA